MTEERSFIEELVREAEEKEELRTQAYYDLLLLEIQKMNQQIADTFLESDKEIEIIRQWALSKNAKLQTKIEWLELKLEAYIREQGVKTLELAHGTLKMHKKQDKVEITDLELFLRHADAALLTVIPEQVKPDLNKIKAFLKTHQMPKGVGVIEGKEEFSYKLRKENENNGRQEEAGDTAESADEYRTAV